jgi:acetate kinase
MREIEAAMAQGNDRARLAFAIFVRRLASGIASLVPALGGIDVLVFTGGIGENSGAVRDAALECLRFLDEFRVLVIPTNEEWEMARQVSALIR